MDAPGGVATLVGRTDELKRLLRAVQGGGALLVGDPGIGKTTVWRAAIEQLRTESFLVLAASPTAAERLFSYAVLADLIEPLQAEMSELPAPQRNVLQHALLIADDDAPVDPHLVSVAVRALLSRCARQGKLAVAIDDAQWADEASFDALWFALRRAPQVVLLATVRSGASLHVPFDVERLGLDGLSPGALHHMIVEHLGYSLPRPTLLRVHEISAGNPFYALELARRSGSGEAVGLPDSLRALLADRITALPVHTREALAKASLGDVWDGDLAPAVDSGVLGPTRPYRFSHPLYAEAAAELAGATVRQRLHREIAAVSSNPEVRAQHLALSTSHPDADIASALEEAAQGAGRRGAMLASSAMWRSAAQLTPYDDSARQAERWVECGIALLLAGGPDEAAELLAEHLPHLPPGPLRHRGSVHLALLEARTDCRAVIPHLDAILAEADEPHVRHEVVALLATYTTMVGEGARGRALVQAHVCWTEDRAPELLPAALLMAAARETLDDRPAWELLDRARAAGARDSSRPAWGWALRAPALMREDRWDEARQALEQAQREEPATTVYREASFALSLTMIELALGDARSAAERADDVLCIGEQIGAPHMSCQGHIACAEAAALLGHVTTADQHLDAAAALAEAVHASLYLDSANHVRGFLRLSLGDFRGAAEAFMAASDDGYQHYGAIAGGRIQLDAIEAISLDGSLEKASRLTSTIPGEAWEHGVAQALLLAADGRFEAALNTLGQTATPASPFRQARNLLLEGRWQRMLRRRTAARESLMAARSLFTSISATLWEARVDDEIARLGGRRRAGTTLTESERRVAELVSAGLSNKEVARRLVVSQRTVEVHLTKIYTKLDVAGRTALAARWPLI